MGIGCQIHLLLIRFSHLLAANEASLSLLDAYDLFFECVCIVADEESDSWDNREELEEREKCWTRNLAAYDSHREHGCQTHALFTIY